MTKFRNLAAVLTAVAMTGLASSDASVNSSPRRTGVDPAADSNLVVVAPFTITGADAALPDLRDWTQDLFVARLTGEGSPRGLRAPLASLDVVNHLGAGLLLRGAIAGAPARLSIEVTLIPVRDAGASAHARLQGSADSLPYLVDQLLATLLTIRAFRAGEDSTALARASLPTLRAYLAGRAAYRRGRIHDAERDFERALFLDSGFSPAGMGVAAVRTHYWRWSPDQRWLPDVLWSRRTRLSEADRALLVAYLGPHYPGSSTLSERIAAAEHATRVAANRIDAWCLAGAYLLKYGPLAGYPEWEARSLAMFKHAFTLDSTYAPMLEYLVLLAAGAGDHAALRRYAGLYFVHNPDAEAAHFVRWWAAVALGDSAALAGLRSGYSRIHEWSVWRMAMWGQEQGGGGLEDVDRALIGVLGTQHAAVARGFAGLLRMRLLLNLGRPTEASRLNLDTSNWFESVGLPEFRIYAGLYWDGDTSDMKAAAPELEADLRDATAGHEPDRERQSMRCTLAHWRAARGDFDGARAALGMIGHPPPTDFLTTEATSICRATVTAMVAVGRHDPDAAAALERLDSLLRAGGNWDDFPVTLGNIVAARLFEARRDLPRALAAIRRHTWNGALLSTRLREEGRLAELGGDRAGAIRAFRHYLALRSDPEPRLRAEIDSVRSQVRRLERTGLSDSSH